MDVDIRLNTPGNFTSLPAVDAWAEKYKTRAFNPRIVCYYGPLAENSSISPKKQKIKNPSLSLLCTHPQIYIYLYISTETMSAEDFELSPGREHLFSPLYHLPANSFPP